MHWSALLNCGFLWIVKCIFLIFWSFENLVVKLCFRDHDPKVTLYCCQIQKWHHDDHLYVPSGYISVPVHCTDGTCRAVRAAKNLVKWLDSRTFDYKLRHMCVNIVRIEHIWTLSKPHWINLSSIKYIMLFSWVKSFLQLISMHIF